MSQQQQSSSFLSNSVLEMPEIFFHLMPDELEDSLLVSDILEEAAAPRGIPDEATNVFNMEQDTNIELIDLGDSDSDSEREATEEEEINLNTNGNGPIDVLAERVTELERMIQNIFLNPGCLEVRLTNNLEPGNQPPIDISIADEPQGINNEATNVVNMEQDANIEIIELGDSDSDSEREVTEEEEKTVKSIINKKARIDVNVLAERVEELEKVIHKKTANPDSLKVRVKDKSSGETKFFYLNYVQDGRNLNAVKFAKQAKKYIVKSPGAKNGYLKCVCLICRESGQEIIGRSNFLVEHIMRTQKVKIQCVYCDRLVQSHQRSKEHVRKYHWKSGENIVLDKENLKK